jgi:hypothetical protein
MENTSQLEVAQEQGAFSIQGFDHAQRVAKMLSTSSLIPKEYQGNIQNTMIALEMASRIGASPLMVMQNLYIVHGRPGWSSTFIIAALNSCKRFSPIRFVIAGEGEEYGCTAWAYDLNNEEKLEGPKVTMKMANLEGWIAKAGSKWKTMPELMLRYRAAAFFGRLYAPDILMGMQTAEEIIDVEPVIVSQDEIKKQKESERITLLIQDANTLEELTAVEPHVQPEQLDLFLDKKAKLTEGK